MAVRALRSLRRSIPLYLFCRSAIPLWILFAAAFVEVWFHSRHLAVHGPQDERDWDEPFATSCQNVTANAEGARENAAFVMLTRNSDLENALHSIQSIERHFNRWFHYPMVFLNNEPWSQDFISAMNETASGKVQFEVIPKDLWIFPDHVDKDAAIASIKAQGQLGEYSRANKAGIESYHHMCRFYSGDFYKLPVLEPYKWYWRIEPDIDLYCDLTYDPFVKMAKRGKAYGYTIAIQETTATCPSLFNHAAEYKETHQFRTTEGWKAVMSPSWLPWPFRAMLSPGSNRDGAGDIWSRCQYWSNFEIADLDFFRSKQYQAFFNYLDQKGGFYFERWGDAPIHSLAIAMLMDPKKIHNFQDIGYRHDWLFQCPGNAPGGQFPELTVLNNQSYAPEMKGGIGCRCECNGRKPRNFSKFCLKKLSAPNTRRSWF